MPLGNLLNTNLFGNFVFGLQNWCDSGIGDIQRIMLAFFAKLDGKSMSGNFKPIG